MKFAGIVRSDERVRDTFDRISGWALWWRIVLALHGKPLSEDVPPERKTAILVRGFRFYGYLYLGLGLTILAGAVAWLVIESPSWYWTALALFGAVYLIASSRLAFLGAGLLGSGQARGAILLVTFFVFVLIFLAAFGAFVSSWIHDMGKVPDLPNALLFAVFLLFGIGSYVIELLYLLWWRAASS
jgi:hypothetical protein